jgi:hypothetical protein
MGRDSIPLRVASAAKNSRRLLYCCAMSTFTSWSKLHHANDYSAGPPMETSLQLLLPLDNQVCLSACTQT